MIEGTETNTTKAAGTPEGAPPAEGKAYAAPATQADLDRIIEARLAREREKFADYTELKTKASAYDEAEAKNKTELERAQEAAAKAEARAAKAEGDALRARIAGEKGVPAGLLSGSTEAELLASADQLLEFKGAGQSKGAPPAGAGADPNTPAERSAKDTVDAALRR